MRPPFGAQAKEVGIVSFALFVGLEAVDALCGAGTLGPAPSLADAARRFGARDVVARVAAAVGCAVLVLYLHTMRHGDTMVYKWTVLENSVAATLGHDRLGTLLSYLHLHARYFYKLVVPLELCYDYGYPCLPHVTSLDDPLNLGTLGLYVGVAGVGAYGVAARSRPVLASLVLGVVPFLPAAQLLLPVGTMLGERLLYLPSVGFCLGAARALAVLRVDGRRTSPPADRAFAKTFKARLHGLVPSRRAVALAQRTVAAAVFLGFAARTVSRNGAWASEKTLFEASLDVCPTSLKVLNNLALVLLNGDDEASIAARDLPRARTLLDLGLGGHAAFPSALYNRGLVHHLEDRRVAAIEDFSEALRDAPRDARVETYLGQELWLLMRQLDRVYAPDTDLADLRTGLLELSAAHLDKGDKNLPLTHWAIASVAFELGDHVETERHAILALDGSRAVRRSGTNLDKAVKEAPTYNLLGLARRALGRDDAATRAYEEGLAMDPDSFELLSNAASLYVDRGMYDQATALFERAIALQPNSAEVLNNFGFFLETKGDLHEALDLYTRAQQLLLPNHHPQIDTNVRNVAKRIQGAEPGAAGVRAAAAPPPEAPLPRQAAPPNPPQQASPTPPDYTTRTDAQRAPNVDAKKDKPAFTWSTTA